MLSITRRSEMLHVSFKVVPYHQGSHVSKSSCRRGNRHRILINTALQSWKTNSHLISFSVRKEMASSDEQPAPVAAKAEAPQPPGKAMTTMQQVVDKGAQMLQSLKPLKQMSQHVCTFALYSHDLTRQIETHHYISRLNQDFLQAAVYDSDDSNARLIGLYQFELLRTFNYINFQFPLQI